MSSWQRAIEAACEAVEACKRRGVMPRLFDNAIAAIRAIPEPPAPSEKEVVERMARAIFNHAVLHDASDVIGAAREALAVVRGHDSGEVERLRAALSDATRSLETIAREAMSECLSDALQVRGYANSRAFAARAALGR